MNTTFHLIYLCLFNFYGDSYILFCFSIGSAISLSGYVNMIVVQDGKLSAQFEQTMVVTDTGVDVLTARPGKRFTPYFMESWNIII